VSIAVRLAKIAQSVTPKAVAGAGPAPGSLIFADLNRGCVRQLASRTACAGYLLDLTVFVSFVSVCPLHFFAYFQETKHPILLPLGHFFGHDIGIRFYSLAYLMGFFILFVGLRWQARRGWSRLRGDAIVDYVTWVAIVGTIVGGRLGYCLFYEPTKFLSDPLFFFRLWEGGMASHGGIIGVIVVMIVYARHAKIPFYNLADATAFCVPITLGLGRCANFLNGELWGRPTDSWWGVIFSDAPPVWLADGSLANVPRYPSQLIEAVLEGLVLQLVLIAVRFGTKREGAVALTFMAVYALLRIVGEQFRQPDADLHYPFMVDNKWFGLVSQGQALSGLMLLITAVLAYLQFFTRRAPDSRIESSSSEA
jgi:phosphatidylglycerol---prolipoprotein diacylglyceryl transferase